MIGTKLETNAEQNSLRLLYKSGDFYGANVASIRANSEADYADKI